MTFSMILCTISEIRIFSKILPDKNLSKETNKVLTIIYILIASDKKRGLGSSARCRAIDSLQNSIYDYAPKFRFSERFF